MTSLPLAHKRILVTRAAHQASKLSDGLRAAGAEPVEVPVLEIRPPESYDALDAALHNLSTYDLIILTSANAVHAIVERTAACGVVNNERKPQIAAVGKATAEAAGQAGFSVALTPKEYVAESLLESLADLASGQRILLARAAIARDLIPDTLRATGAIVDVVDAYQNAIPQDAPAKLRAALASRIDAATFTSSSSVTHLADVARVAGIAFPFSGVKAISIGPITSATLREHNWPPAAEADPHDIPGLIAAVISQF
ncbi:uroporphyrinogen-III synthase [Occallatibacter savannae]|uniref:uroporphyrinogen-III synthase n=1 Tax=Occallatibacter savannae TaxID=1002691 RepID=UPI0013A58947|nr:uroporphyrinogen-III synthase [Occallatibacter savannae]